MPALSLASATSVYRSPSDLPPCVWNAFKANPRNANVMYGHASKSLSMEQAGLPLRTNDLWITSYPHNNVDSIEFVLSCTDGPLGTYPIFIFSTRQLSDLDMDFVVPRMKALTSALYTSVNSERVYSVFAVDPVARIFAEFWRQLTGIAYYREPYYAAKLTFCTTKTLKRRKFTILEGISYDMRLANNQDVEEVAELCFGFASASAPFAETREQATEEATRLVDNGQVWVHTVKKPGMDQEEIASLVAVTREGGSVAAITKVYTNPRWRGRRCAERLVRYVCDLKLKTKESVVLYVAHENPAANKVYHRVGFQGLGETAVPVQEVEPWLEIGFDRNITDLGMW